ncbi:SAM hydrolase/SAM-dependent halogenase family protein [Thalassospira mesophila]|uniref:Uncharacterized protein n=1 Tax=Thalassospira mesophila TaxID=1293891 RepID=A0A1Y2L0V1_9PROT|nr:SAM-dependent chlorinase/fluorinase [Thalassospira mesophila]OSQ38856.1 hypothetical protein TMES_08865 [Thalassospira mesophila]
MILVFSDFQTAGPYSGAMRAAAMRHANPAGRDGGQAIAVVDLMVDAPDRDPMKAGCLLAACAGSFAAGDVGLCVIDPGVGSARRGVIVQCDDVWFVGPDNGLFEFVIRRARTVRMWQIDWKPAALSASFHGRDIFGPVAGMLAAGQDFAKQEMDVADRFADAKAWPDDIAEIIYCDGYGNAMTGVRAQQVEPGQNILEIGDLQIGRARTFSDVRRGAPLWYENAFGLVEIAVNGGRADRLSGVAIGASIGWGVGVKAE